jgi:PAS domain S-box-containing protein
MEISILKEATMQNNDLKNELKRLRSRLHELEKCEKNRSEMDNKYKRLVENTPIISYIYGIKSGAIFWSNRIQSLLGFSPDTLNKDPFAWINAIHPDDQTKVKALFTSLSTITSFSIEYRVKDNHGNWHWFNDSSISVIKTDKEYIIEGIAIDITKQKLAENELKISEEKYRLIVERANDGIEITQNNKIIYTNNRFAEILGYKLDELKNISFSKIFSKQGKLDLKQRQHKRENEESLPNNYETTFVGKNGELIDVDVNYQIIDFHGKSATFAIIRDISESKRLSKELHKLSTAVQQSPSIIVITDLEGKLEYVNPKFNEITGYTTQEVIGKTPRILKSGMISDSVYKKLWNTVLSGNTWRGEFYNKKKNNKFYWENAAITPIYDQEGKMINFLKVAEDITDHKNIEEALRLSEEKYRLIVENANDGIIISQEDELVYSNTRFADILGYSVDELHHFSFKNIYTKQGIHDLFEREKNRLSGEQIIPIYETTFKKKNGAIVTVNVNYQIIDYHNRPATFAIIRDITERKQTEEALRKSEKKYKDLFEKSEDAILILHNGKFTDCNQATVKMLRYNNKNELLNMHPSELSPEKQADGKRSLTKANEIIEMALENGSYRFEWNHKRSDGEVFPVEVLLTAVSINEKDQILYTVLRDITERKKAEENIRAALEKAEESDRLKSAFLANVSHEIRTPMNGIMGFARLLRQKELSGETQNQYLDVIEKSSQRMLNIINDLMDISKIESGQMEVNFTKTNINEVIKFISVFFEPECKNNDILLRAYSPLEDKDAIIHTDKDKLEAILTNLLKNAIKFTNTGGIEFGYELNGDKLVFFVDDTGIGIPKEQQEHIFDRFVQVDSSTSKPYEGAGLGLSISKAFAEMLGGHLQLRSNVKEGSRFYFTIPYITKGVETSLNNSANNLDDHKTLKINKLKVLIAEDDESSFLYLNILIKPYCRSVLYAKNGAEAIALCKNDPDIDLLLMDMKMPLLDGYEATKNIREFNKNIIIVAQTAYAFSHDRQKVLDTGCNDYLAKPIQENELKLLIEKYFGE